jgi:hypothetical protein
MFTLFEIDFKSKAVKRDEEDPYKVIKVSAECEEITNICVCISYFKALKYIKQMLIDLK